MNHGITNGKEVKFKKNDALRIRAGYNDTNCTWAIYGKRIAKTEGYQINTLQPNESCGRTLNHKLATAKYLAGRYLEDFKLVRRIDI